MIGRLFCLAIPIESAMGLKPPRREASSARLRSGVLVLDFEGGELFDDQFGRPALFVGFGEEIARPVSRERSREFDHGLKVESIHWRCFE